VKEDNVWAKDDGRKKLTSAVKLTVRKQAGELAKMMND
jgi:hypothetical protein